MILNQDADQGKVESLVDSLKAGGNLEDVRDLVRLEPAPSKRSGFIGKQYMCYFYMLLG